MHLGRPDPDGRDSQQQRATHGHEAFFNSGEGLAGATRV